MNIYEYINSNFLTTGLLVAIGILFIIISVVNFANSYSIAKERKIFLPLAPFESVTLIAILFLLVAFDTLILIDDHTINNEIQKHVFASRLGRITTYIIITNIIVKIQQRLK